MIAAINMMDIVRKNGDQIRTEQLAKELGCQVVEISALKGTGHQRSGTEGSTDCTAEKAHDSAA